MSEHAVDLVESNGARLAVHAWTTAKPRFLALLVHGYGEHLGRYGHVAEALLAHRAVVFGPDHRGHGLSDGERVFIDDFATVVEDLEVVVESMRLKYPGVPLIVIGHSMGGLIATRYAQQRASTLKALVLSGPLLGYNTAITDLLDLPSIPDTPLDVSTLSRDPAVGERYSRDPLVWHGSFKRTTLHAMREMLETINRGPSLGTLPTLWLHGGDDRLVRPEDSRGALETIRGSRFEMEMFPDARHEIFNEINKDVVLKRVTGFVESVL